jgi:hypothetical protein
MTITVNRSVCTKVRSDFLFGFGTHLAISGLVVLAIYYLVSTISANEARDLLSWLLPAGQASCLAAAILLATSLTVKDNKERVCKAAAPRRPSPTEPSPSRRTLWARLGRRTRRDFGPELEKALRLVETLEWKSFKNLAIAYFEEVGFRTVDQLRRSRGVDFLLYLPDEYEAIAVRCLPLDTAAADLKQVRDFHRAVLLSGASEGVIMAEGAFAEEAVAFARENGIEAIGGRDFASRLAALPAEKSERLLQAVSANAVRGD